MARIMTFVQFSYESKQLFQSLKLLNIYELKPYLTALFIFSYFNDKLPITFNDYFTKNGYSQMDIYAHLIISTCKFALCKY